MQQAQAFAAHEPAVLRRGAAARQIGFRPRAHGLHETGFARGRGQPQQRACGRFDHARGHAAAVPVEDDVVSRAGLGPGQSHLLKSKAVARGHPAGDMLQDDGMTGAGPVEILSCGMALFRKQAVVIAPALDALPRRRDLRPLPEQGHHVLDAVDAAEGIAVQVHRCGQQGRIHKMAVRVDEARQQRSPGQIDLPRPGMGQRPHGVQAARRQDAVPGHGHGFRPRIGCIHAEDRASEIDGVGLRRLLLYGVSPCHAHGTLLGSLYAGPARSSRRKGARYFLHTRDGVSGP